MATFYEFDGIGTLSQRLLPSIATSIGFIFVAVIVNAFSLNEEMSFILFSGRIA
jgi:hypothetical protein